MEIEFINQVFAKIRSPVGCNVLAEPDEFVIRLKQTD